MAERLTVVETNARSIDAVMAVMEEAFDPNFGEAWRREQCLGILDLPGVWLALGFREELAVGFALGRIIADEAELLLIAVIPSARRQGLGALLLESMIDAAAVRGARRLHLEMREGNSALELYRRFGFIPVGKRCSYYHGQCGQSFDALTLTRILDDISAKKK